MSHEARQPSLDDPLTDGNQSVQREADEDEPDECGDDDIRPNVLRSQEDEIAEAAARDDPLGDDRTDDRERHRLFESREHVRNRVRQPETNERIHPTSADRSKQLDVSFRRP